ncbi:thermonuclease family protein [Nitrospirillum sp. BR 11163]|uniref:thermonuclease family protein n=1 Tax=Nitrospirillum sp. BR 11163 TaxID=3104323 RepID=UPI002AFE207D|nr:thermonuclease family protein [Nitrospirillum sp. BR 11163]MEA1675426.1 thermonuclease family protein [Nitrospirillum sp. BR 11163]
MHAWRLALLPLLIPPLLILTVAPPAAARTHRAHHKTHKEHATKGVPKGAHGLIPAGSGVVIGVLSGDTVTLRDGRVVRLAGILAPKTARTGRPQDDNPSRAAWPLAEDSRHALEDLVLNRTVSLMLGGVDHDRYGRVLAHLMVRDGRRPVWVQDTLLRRGWVELAPHPDAPKGLAPLRRAEGYAREHQLGLWADGFYAVRDPDTAFRAQGRYAIVTGRVLDAADARDHVYLNFGADRRTDFTVEIDRRDMAAFRARHLSPLDLKDRLVEVRGWVEEHNGPMIRVTNPDQIITTDGRWPRRRPARGEKSKEEAEGGGGVPAGTEP